MYKKFILFFILFNFISHCGFTPIYSNKTNLNFSITSTEFEGEKIINIFLKNNLNQYKNNKHDRKFKIKIKTEYNKNILSKNKSAATTNFQLTFNAEFQIISNDKIIKILNVSEKVIMDNINDDFEEQKNERIAKQNFASSATNKLLTEISILNDN